MNLTISLKFLCLVLVCSCASTPASNEKSISTNHKINGVSLVSSRDTLHPENVTPLVELHANHAAIMPFAFLSTLNSPDVRFNNKRQWFGETGNGIQQYSKQLAKGNIKIMLKPQIWVRNGEFTGDILMNSEEDWKKLESSYESFILYFAKVAEESNTDIFCIGTELRQFQENRPDFWLSLIKDVKEIYKGELTYAANWDEYKKLTFWSELDYIGVDAYFPITDEKTPSVKQCRAGWQEHKSKMKEISDEYSKPILFTEFGYCSRDYAMKEPWNPADKTLNLQAQTNGLQALFDEFWSEEWFAGGFVWKWFHGRENIGGVEDVHFTPQNKPAEKVIQRAYGKH